MDFNILLYQIAGNTLGRYTLFTAVFSGSIILLKLLKFIIFSRIKKFVQSTDSKTDDMIFDDFQKNLIPLMYITAAFLSADLLNISTGLDRVLNYIFVILLAFFITRFFISISVFLINRLWLIRDENDSGSSVAILINMVIKIVIWSVSILILLDNMGVKVSGLIAGFGVGGVALAFAAQSVLRDFFNYFTIFFDRPFEIGDFLVIGEFKGNVEHIGIKTTRLRSLSGELLIFANTDLTGSRVRNYKSMQERRVLFTFGITYQTPVQKLNTITDEIKKIITGIKTARFDRAHFSKFGDSSLDFEVVYYVLSGEYNIYMDIQQDINIKLMMLLKKMKVEFAYPTRTLFMENMK